ncbi:MAG: beta-lactamase family protein [Spirochaetales bacterium]|nr:beta-lactamase family protein [Spirochaetales bacterium]
MKLLVTIFLFCLSSCCLLFPPYLKKVDNVILERKIDIILKDDKLPAMAAAVVEGGTILAKAATGNIVYKTGEPVDVEKSRFHIGSTTKGVTATLIAILVEQGKLSWDTTLKELFPDMVMRKEYENATIHHLLTSTAGIVPMQDSEKEPWAPVLWEDIPSRYRDPVKQRIELTRAALSMEPVAELGKTFYYSNTGWGILGAVAEKVSGVSFEELMQKKIFDVLGMTHTKIGGWPASLEEPNQPRGHYGKLLNPYTNEYHYKELKEPSPQNLDDEYVLPAWMNPAGGIHCTITDYALFARDQLLGLQGKGKLLTKESYEKIHSEYKMTNVDGREMIMGYGFGMAYICGGKHKISAGDGSGGTFYARILVYPKLNMAFVCFTNCGNGEKAITKLMMSLVGGILL